MNKCPKCGCELITEINGSTLITRCTKCDFSIVTTETDPIYEDESEYKVFLAEGNTITRENYFLLQSLVNKNLPEIKDMLGNPPVLIFEGSAPEVKELKDRLDACNVKHYIVPDFVY